MIPAHAQVRFGTNEILVSLMLVYVAEAILASMSHGWLSATPRDGLSRQPQPAAIPGPTTESIAGTGMHWGVVAAFIAVIFAYVLLNRHMLGFQIRLAGRRRARRASPA
jgi:ABC-type uncharacterized transport system permease subunit